VLAPETGFVVSVTGVMRKHHRQLDISVGISGPHDFTVRLQRRPSSDIARVHRISHPTFVTIAKRPSDWGVKRSELVAVICPSAQGGFEEEEGEQFESATPK